MDQADDIAASGAYYNDLLHRVDDATARGESGSASSERRSAYGGDQYDTENGDGERCDADECGYKTLHCHAYVLWGLDDERPVSRETRLHVVALFVAFSLAFSLEAARSGRGWVALWALGTFLAHCVCVCARLVSVRLDDAQKSRRAFWAALAACCVWCLARLFTDGGRELRLAARVWLAVAILGAVLCETCARLATAALKHAPFASFLTNAASYWPAGDAARAADAANEEGLQYAAL